VPTVTDFVLPDANSTFLRSETPTHLAACIRAFQARRFA
jgi:hypothetical protein